MKYLYRFKMAAKYMIFISRHFDFGENLKKNTFSKEFANGIWLKDATYLIFFFSPKKRKYYLGNYKNYQPELLQR